MYCSNCWCLPPGGNFTGLKSSQISLTIIQKMLFYKSEDSYPEFFLGIYPWTLTQNIIDGPPCVFFQIDGLLQETCHFKQSGKWAQLLFSLFISSNQLQS